MQQRFRPAGKGCLFRVTAHRLQFHQAAQREEPRSVFNRYFSSSTGLRYSPWAGGGPNTGGTSKLAGHVGNRRILFPLFSMIFCEGSRDGGLFTFSPGPSVDEASAQLSIPNMSRALTILPSETALQGTPPALWRKLRDLEKTWKPRKFAVLVTERDEVCPY